ncbi:MAG: glycosyltransferase family 39 protein [Nitrospirae bacterium]|nr:glycosyltransferase family 39 protein [Nitrospirota bacterium]
MVENQRSCKKGFATLIIVLLAISAYPALYLFRSLDDNRLSSWNDAFAGVEPFSFFLILTAGIVCAYIISRFSSLEKNPVIFLFPVSYVIPALFWNEPEIILDASRYFTQAKHLEVYGISYFFQEWGRDISVWTDLPVVPFLYGLIFKFFGESRIYIQVFTSLLFSMSAVLTYLIGKMLWDKDTGFYGALLFLGIPYMFTQVPLMLVDIPTLFFLTLSISTLIMALEKGGCFILLSSFSIFLTVFSKYSTWLMLSVLVVVVIVVLIRNSRLGPRSGGFPPRAGRPRTQAGSPRRRGDAEENESSGATKLKTQNYIYRSSIIGVITGLLIFTFVWYKYDVFSEQINLLLTYQKPRLRRWGESFISTFFFQIHPFITIAALYSVYASFRKRDLKYAIIIWLVLLVLLFQIKRMRYILPVLPMISLMASYGLMHIKDRMIVRFISLSVVVSSVILAFFVFRPFIEKTSSINIRDAGIYLNSFGMDKIEVFIVIDHNSEINPSVYVPMLDLFTDGKIHYEYDTSQPLMEKIETSPLRFTWTYKNPRYYSSLKADSGQTVVVISDRSNPMLPPDIEDKVKRLHISKRLNISDDVYRNQVFMTVYH